MCLVLNSVDSLKLLKIFWKFPCLAENPIVNNDTRYYFKYSLFITNNVLDSGKRDECINF